MFAQGVKGRGGGAVCLDWGTWSLVLDVLGQAFTYLPCARTENALTPKMLPHSLFGPGADAKSECSRTSILLVWSDPTWQWCQEGIESTTSAVQPHDAQVHKGTMFCRELRQDSVPTSVASLTLDNSRYQLPQRCAKIPSQSGQANFFRALGMGGSALTSSSLILLSTDLRFRVIRYSKGAEKPIELKSS